MNGLHEIQGLSKNFKQKVVVLFLSPVSDLKGSFFFEAYSQRARAQISQ